MACAIRDEAAEEWSSKARPPKRLIAVVHGIKNHAEYLKLIGDERLKDCVEQRERRQV
jgi:hypothetical protein